MKRVTTSDVANAAGVSQTTASMVLSGSARVVISEKTRQKVLSVARELGYQPQKRATRMLLLLIPTLTNQYYSDLAQAVEECAENQGVHVVLCNTFRQPELERSYLEAFSDRRIAGILYAFLPGDPARAEAVSRRIPTVIIGEKQPSLSIPSIELSNIAAGIILTEHLLSLGHRQLAFLSTPINQLTLARAQRLEGIRQTLERHGLKDNLTVLVAQEGAESEHGAPLPYEYRVGRQLMATLLSQQSPTTAVIGVNDMTAIGILDEARSQGLRVPEELSVCGFDNIFSTGVQALGLTTIDHMLRARCREAVNLLLSQAEGNEAPRPHKIEFAPKLVARTSTGLAPLPRL